MGSGGGVKGEVGWGEINSITLGPLQVPKLQLYVSDRVRLDITIKMAAIGCSVTKS